MAQGDFGGDGSVAWKIDVDQLRPNSAHSHGPGGGPGHGAPKHHQDGIDETNPGQFFTIYLEVPRDPADKGNLVTSLRAAASALEVSSPGSGAKVSFNLRIENENRDQISVHWDSRP